MLRVLGVNDAYCTLPPPDGASTLQLLLPARPPPPPPTMPPLPPQSPPPLLPPHAASAALEIRMILSIACADNADTPRATTPKLLERQLWSGHFRLEALALDRAHARVPAQHTIDITGAQFPSALVPLHRVPEAVVRRRADDVLAAQVRSGLALEHDAGVIGALVLVAERLDVEARLRGRRRRLAELIGERE